MYSIHIYVYAQMFHKMLHNDLYLQGEYGKNHRVKVDQAIVVPQIPLVLCILK